MPLYGNGNYEYKHSICTLSEINQKYLPDNPINN